MSDGRSSETGGSGARVALSSLLEVLQVAIAKVSDAQARPWEAGEIARSWMEHEIAPLVARLLEVGLPSSRCPVCREGEEFVAYPPFVDAWRRRPLGESYTCGHWVRFSASVQREADYDVLMPMSTEINIRQNTSAQISNRPRDGAFRPGRIVLGGHPDRWRIDGIFVGNKSQLSGAGSIPGSLFSCVAVDLPAISFEMVQTAMDFTLVVTYVGPLPDGEPFEAVVLGVAARWRSG